MSASTVTASHRAGPLRVGVSLSLVVMVIDVAGMIAVGLPNAPALVNVIVGLTAVGTLIGGIVAWRGAKWAAWLVIVTRFISALGVVPLLFVPAAPKDAVPMSVALLVLTVIAIVFLLVGLRRRPAAHSR